MLATAVYAQGDLIVSDPAKDIQVWKRAYRTKGKPAPNVIPQPAIRGITQRAGTNLIELDVEIIDPTTLQPPSGYSPQWMGISPTPLSGLFPRPMLRVQVPRSDRRLPPTKCTRWSGMPAPTGRSRPEILSFKFFVGTPAALHRWTFHFLTLPLEDGPPNQSLSID